MKVFRSPATSAISPTRKRARSIECAAMSPSAPEPACLRSSRQTSGKVGSATQSCREGAEARAGDPVLQVGAAVVTNVPELAALDQLLGKHHRRRAAVVVADHVD